MFGNPPCSTSRATRGSATTMFSCMLLFFFSAPSDASFFQLSTRRVITASSRLTHRTWPPSSNHSSNSFVNLVSLRLSLRLCGRVTHIGSAS
ncbi:hypothetical protein P280DRAFT_232008 [Massarina eburnea CBS 473.64]|uniref:Secreted protein n=1 Tax=Massarina eburnea CBS 473.64 TaxID=1395130 RepID=A0A6A6RI23_9PLEO|nr:hypothetical protein P280DRAFT_232008 [Massarina eburnea CBS 473.64]